MKKLLMAVAVMACVFTASADDSRPWLPLGISLVTPPLQLPSPSHTVFGAMINIGYGQVDNLAVLDLGLINNVTDTMTGLELAPVNLVGTCLGAQVGALNIASRTIGVQLGILNMTGDLHGVQLGLVNMSRSGGALIFPLLNLGF